VAENTGKNQNTPFDIQVPKPSAKDEVESAKILMQEGLLDEAKRLLHRVLISNPNYSRANQMLKEIQKIELDHLLNRSSNSSGGRRKIENPDEVIRKLESDLEIELSRKGSDFDPARENWNPIEALSIQGAFDLAVAFFEMGCFRDAVRELDGALRRVRQEQSSLDEVGIAIVVLQAECQIELDEAFEAKVFLAPILNEPELSHEAKLPLYYLAGRAEQALGYRAEAKAWYEKVIGIDPLFRDTHFRIRVL